MVINIYEHVYNHETTAISGWCFSGCNVHCQAWNTYLEIHYFSTSCDWKIMNAFFLERTRLKRNVLYLLAAQVVNFWLALYLAFNTCHCLFFVRCFVYGSHFSHVCFCVAWTYVSVWHLKIWSWCLLVEALMTYNFVRLYSCNFVILLNHWISCQLSIGSEHWLMQGEVVFKGN